MGTFMEYFNAFWVGGLICALCQILLDRTKMLPGRIMVTLVVHGRGVELSGTLRSICRIRRGRRVGAAARVRASFVSGSKRCRKRKRIFRIVPGRIKGGGCRNISGVDFRVSCKLDFPAEDEKIAGEKLRRSRRTDIIKKNAAEKSRIAAAGRIQKKAGVLRKKQSKHPRQEERKSAMKTREEALSYGLSFPDTYQEAPFHDDNWQLIRVKGSKKAFLWVYEKDGIIQLNVKANPEWRDYWRDAFASVIPGYHQNKEHWNTILLDGTVPDDAVRTMIAESYDIITDSPTKRIYEAVKQIPRGKWRHTAR